jgi:flagellar protein FliO/FliZ
LLYDIDRIPVWPTLVIRYRKPPLYRSARTRCALLCVSFSGPALAQAASDVAGLSATTLLQTLLGLAVVIGLLFLAAFLLRKVNGGRGFGSHGPLRIIGGLMLGNRERIVLLEVGDSWIVVGLVPGQIRTLHTLPKGELKPGGGERHFAQWLKQVAERKNEDH